MRKYSGRSVSASSRSSQTGSRNESTDSFRFINRRQSTESNLLWSSRRKSSSLASTKRATVPVATSGVGGGTGNSCPSATVAEKHSAISPVDNFQTRYFRFIGMKLTVEEVLNRQTGAVAV